MALAVLRSGGRSWDDRRPPTGRRLILLDGEIRGASSGVGSQWLGQRAGRAVRRRRLGGDQPVEVGRSEDLAG